MKNEELNLILEEVAAEEAASTDDEIVVAFKKSLPFLYSNYGKLRKAEGSHRISGKNAAALLTMVNDVSNSGFRIMLHTPMYTVHFTQETSGLIRAYGMVAEIMLAGHLLTIGG